MVTPILLAVVVLLVTALNTLLLGLARLSRNAGRLDLEDYAFRNRVVFIPVAEELAAELRADFSKPVRIKLERHPHPLLGQLVLKSEP